MLQLEAEEDQVSISCSAYGVYPEPIINITYSGRYWLNKKSRLFKIKLFYFICYSNTFNDIDNQSIRDEEDGMYNVTQIVTMRSDDLEDLSEFVCELSFPDTNFTIDKKLKFISGKQYTNFKKIPSLS